VVQRLVSLDSASFNSSDLGQLHQFFLSCSVETRLVVEAIKDMRFVKETCCLAFEGKQTKSSPSATQQQVSETLRLGLSWRTRFAAQGRGIPLICSTAPWRLEARRAVGGV